MELNKLTHPAPSTKETSEELSEKPTTPFRSFIQEIQKISNDSFALHTHSFAPSADFCTRLDRLEPLPQHFVEQYELWTEQAKLAWSSSTLIRIGISMGLFSLLLARSGLQDLPANWHHLAAALPLAISSLALIPQGISFWTRSLSALQKTANNWQE